MKTLQEIVTARLTELGLGPIEAATAGGLERTFIRDITVGKKKSVKSDKIVQLGKALMLDPDALARNEALPVSETRSEPALFRPAPNASFPPQYQQFNTTKKIPLMGQSEAGPDGRFIMNGQKIADVFCPPGLENVPDAYAVRVFGTSMEPRYRAGETVWLNPQLPVRSGDDVVVQLKAQSDGDELASYIKEFRSRSSKVLRLWQHNPEDGESHDIDIDNRDVFSVHVVVYSSRYA
jgi:phage repressor protein C with HTH and peptisase S24 domain